MGSSVYTGQLPLETALAAADIWGISVGEELSRLRLSDSSWVGRPPAAYAELHVEQGARLESDGIEIGVVEGTWAAYKADIAVHGVQTHTGPTPMAQRVDALYAAAKVIAAVREIALAEPNDRLHTSVAWMRVTPNSPNATPSLVELKVELRSRSAEVLSAARGSLERVVNETAEATAAQIVVGPWSERETRDFDPELVERVVAGVEQAGLSCRRMLTIAGHDAVVMNAVGVPTVLLFIPSHDGITHNAEEFTSEVDLENGVIALGEAVALLCHDVAVGTTR